MRPRISRDPYAGASCFKNGPIDQKKGASNKANENSGRRSNYGLMPLVGAHQSRGFTKDFPEPLKPWAA
jgi:hypothetical protein